VPAASYEDRFGITGARWSPDGAETILKLRAVVANGDLDDYMNYYKDATGASATSPTTTKTPSTPQPRRMTETPGNEEPLIKTHPITSRSSPVCGNSRPDSNQRGAKA
jgi:hypothetical protein